MAKVSSRVPSAAADCKAYATCWLAVPIAKLIHRKSCDAYISYQVFSGANDWQKNISEYPFQVVPWSG